MGKLGYRWALCPAAKSYPLIIAAHPKLFGFASSTKGPIFLLHLHQIIPLPFNILLTKLIQNISSTFIN
jgi:hypothetical protein